MTNVMYRRLILTLGDYRRSKYTNIRFFETQNGDSTQLNCYVMLTKSKHKSISFEILSLQNRALSSFH